MKKTIFLYATFGFAFFAGGFALGAAATLTVYAVKSPAWPAQDMVFSPKIGVVSGAHCYFNGKDFPPRGGGFCHSGDAR